MVDWRESFVMLRIGRTKTRFGYRRLPTENIEIYFERNYMHIYYIRRIDINGRFIEYRCDHLNARTARKSVTINNYVNQKNYKSKNYKSKNKIYTERFG